MTEYREVVAHEPATAEEIERVLSFLPAADTADLWVQIERRDTGAHVRCWPRPRAEMRPIGCVLQY